MTMRTKARTIKPIATVANGLRKRSGRESLRAIIAHANTKDATINSVVEPIVPMLILLYS
jgi:hypothetical protein